MAAARGGEGMLSQHSPHFGLEDTAEDLLSYSKMKSCPVTTFVTTNDKAKPEASCSFYRNTKAMNPCGALFTLAVY